MEIHVEFRVVWIEKFLENSLFKLEFNKKLVKNETKAELEKLDTVSVLN